MPKQFGASLAHPYNTNKWTFEASEEVKSRVPEPVKVSSKVTPNVLKEIKPPIIQPKKVN